MRESPANSRVPSGDSFPRSRDHRLSAGGDERAPSGRSPIPLLLLGLFWAGCASVSETFRQNMYVAKYWFDNGRFKESADRYRAAVEEQPDSYDAVIGLANAAAEISHDLYGQADDAMTADKREAAARLLPEADSWAKLANQAFAKAMRLGPSSRQANYGMGLFLYKRATSDRNAPYPASPDVPDHLRGTAREAAWKEGYEQRRKELNEAIRQFALVLERDPATGGRPGHLSGCLSIQAHRYLGLALFLRSDWNQSDGPRARDQLLTYLAGVGEFREYVVRNWPGAKPDEKTAKEREMKRLEVELSDVKLLLRDRVAVLREYEAELRQGKERPAMSPADREKRLGAVSVELEALSALAGAFEKAAGKQP